VVSSLAYLNLLGNKRLSCWLLLVLPLTIYFFLHALLFFDMQVVLDKNKTKMQTVVNKTDAIQNDYRTMQLEVLAGKDSLHTMIIENRLRFQVDLGTVYVLILTQSICLIYLFQKYLIFFCPNTVIPNDHLAQLLEF
jgi:tRNA G37 N-methylase Trm5